MHAASEPAAVPDIALIARVLAGDERHAYAQLVRRHQAAVHQLLRRLARNDHGLADDLAQETFLLAYRKLNQFRGDARFATWLYRIAYNCFLAHARSARAEEALPESLTDETQSMTPSTASALKIDLERALASLPEGERAAIVHCYYQDLTHQEAAYVLGCPVGTVKTHVLRAKQKLALALAAWAPPRPDSTILHGEDRRSPRPYSGVAS